MRIDEAVKVLEPVRDQLGALWLAERNPDVRRVLLLIEKAIYGLRIVFLSEAAEGMAAPHWLEDSLQVLVKDAKYGPLDSLLYHAFEIGRDTNEFVKHLVAGDPTVDYD